MVLVKRVLVLLTVLALATCALLAQRDTATPPKEQPAPTNGTVVGILANKGENWIAVKAEGAKEAVRYTPAWRGGLPSEGGGPDRAILDTIKKLVVTTLVSVTWELQDNQRRIISVKSLTSGEKAGTVSGIMVAKGDAWIDVKPNDGPTERYMAKWIAGTPNAEGKPREGGMDKEMVKAIALTKIGSNVEVKWIADERKRIDTLVVKTEPIAPAPERREGEREQPK